MTQSSLHGLPERIVSGGQTGVDRAALDVARALGLDHGGWCPRGRLAEDGAIPVDYPMTEMSSPQYWMRTRQNVVDSSATLILYRHALRGGSLLTFQFAQRFQKPCLTVDLTQPPDIAAARQWLDAHDVRVLNVAGPRESSSPGIGNAAQLFLTNLLSRRQGRQPTAS